MGLIHTVSSKAAADAEMGVAYQHAGYWHACKQIYDVASALLPKQFLTDFDVGEDVFNVPNARTPSYK